jgi:hypothetical protein
MEFKSILNNIHIYTRKYQIYVQLYIHQPTGSQHMPLILAKYIAAPEIDEDI